MTFFEYLAAWDDLCRQKAILEEQLKPIRDKELEMRKSLAASIEISLGSDYKEGVNKFPLEDGRTLKLTAKIDRKISEDQIPLARAAYEKLNDRPVAFDDLLRAKYELSKRDFDKLSDSAKAAVSDMVTAKPAAPTLEII